MNYLTKKLKEDIKKGGLVIAPRRAGKTTAILELLKESKDSL
jgi:AAA+ ATPase superfamily predicted ATPase